VSVAPNVPSVEVVSHGAAPLLMDSGLTTGPANRATRRGLRRRLLVAVVAAVALAALAGAGVYLGLLISGHPTSVLNRAAATARLSRGQLVPAAARSNGSAAGTLLGWSSVAHASLYTVELIRHGQVIYSATTKLTHVNLPSRWRRDGRPMALSPGTYRWYAWPIVQSGTATRKLAPVVVAAKLKIAP
jgi:hypothetical protein